MNLEPGAMSANLEAGSARFGLALGKSIRTALEAGAILSTFLKYQNCSGDFECLRWSDLGGT